MGRVNNAHPVQGLAMEQFSDLLISKHCGDLPIERTAMASYMAEFFSPVGRVDLLDRATHWFVAQGKSPDEAKALASAALNEPPRVPLPSIDYRDSLATDSV